MRENKRLDSVVLLVIILLTLVVRLAALGVPSLRGDEGYSYYVASQPLAKFPALLAEDVHPPLFYGFLHVWAKFGSSPFWLRLPNALLSVLAIPLIYLLGKQLFSSRVGLIAGILLAVSEVMLRYGQNLRMYPLTVVLILLTALFFVRWYKTMRTRFLAGFVIFGALSLYTHYYTAFALLGIGVFILIRKKMSWQILTACALIVLLFLPWVPVLAKQFLIKATVEPAYFGGKLSWFALGESNIFLRVAMIFFHFSAGFLKTNFASLLFLFLFVVALATFSFLIYKAFASQRVKKGLRSEAVFLTIMVAVPVLIAILLWGFSIITPQTYARQIIIIMPFYYLVLALGLSKAKKLFLPALGIIIILNAVAAYNYYLEDCHREDWDGAALFIKPDSSPADSSAVILITPDSYSHDFRYAYHGSIPAYGLLTNKSIAIGEFSQRAALDAAAANTGEVNLCSFMPLAEGADAVWFVQMSGDQSDPWVSRRACLEEDYALGASWKNTWTDLWGNSGVDVQVFRYGKLNKTLASTG